MIPFFKETFFVIPFFTHISNYFMVWCKRKRAFTGAFLFIKGKFEDRDGACEIQTFNGINAFIVSSTSRSGHSDWQHFGKTAISEIGYFTESGNHL